MANQSQLDPYTLVTRFVSDNSHVEELKFILDDPTGVKVTEITGNGLANYIYRVQSKDNQHSVIIKYGEEQLRVIAAEQITLERQQVEFEGLKLVHEISPGSVPIPYCFDSNHHIIAMSDMKGWDLLADQLEAGVVDVGAACQLGHLLAKVHQVTSKAEVSAERWKQLCETHRGGEVKDITSTFTFEDPYDESSNIFKVSDQALPFFRKYFKEIEREGLRVKLRSLFNQELCFVHADLHWKSIFVRAGDAAIFDLEFAFMGHPANATSFVVISYYIYHLITQNQPQQGHENKMELGQCFKATIEQFLNTYLADLKGSWSEGKDKQLSEIGLFTGALLWSSAVYEGFELFTNVTDVERLTMLHTARRMMLQHEALTSVDNLLAVLFEG